eukprot:scaffold36975_cov221-Amphora_coffeaeformis.AAC.2
MNLKTSHVAWIEEAFGSTAGLSTLAEELTLRHHVFSDDINYIPSYANTIARPFILWTWQRLSWYGIIV